MSQDLLDAGARLVEIGRALGADQVTARVGRGVSSELSQRDGRLESFQESRSLSASVALLVDGRYSVHATSDLRPDALRSFLASAVSATRFLEVDPHRGLPSIEDMGAADEIALDQVDPDWPSITPGDRRVRVEALEAACVGRAARAPVRSVTAYRWDGESRSALVTSNGFSHVSAGTSQGAGATVSLQDEGGRLPEAYAFYQAHHAADLPSDEDIAREVIARAERRLGSGPIASGRYTMLLDAPAVPRMLGVLLAPMSGTAIYEGRSCVIDKLDQQIGAAGLDLFDDPLVPRGLASRAHDGDGLPARRRTILKGGVLRMHLLDTYNARRLGRPVTVGGTSNLVVPAGTRAPDAILAAGEQVIRIEGFLGGNASATTGDFSFGVHGTLFERGEAVAALSEMNVSGNLFDLLQGWVESADDTWLFGAWRAPSMLFEKVQFSGA